MPSHYRAREEDEYEREDYDGYEDYASEEQEEEEDEEKEEPPSQEQQEFLKLREELKERFRKKLKNETAGLGHRSQSKDKRRTTPNDNFGSFFGPSQPVIASRVLEERRSIRDTQHIMSRIPNASSGNAKSHAYTSSEKKTVVHKQQPRVVNEVKKKVQTLKDTRDYSFLLSDDADFPDTKEERPPARKVPHSNADGRLAQAPTRSKQQIAKPARPMPNGHGLKNPSARNIQSQTRAGPVKGAALVKPRPLTAERRKINSTGNDSSRPAVNKALPSKVPAQSTSRPPAKVMNDPYLRNKPSSAVPHSSVQKNRYSDQRQPSQSLSNGKSMPNKPLPSAKSQPPKQFLPRDSNEDRLKKKPMKRRLDESDDEDPIGMIRKMFRYNPNRYATVDDDVSDMEADFREIQKEERRSAKIARKEDEEQLRLIEEEERRERMRKKQKLKR
ncbi:hepatoma-derived growth factor-related protein 2 [Asparagus officinalis]|uniref:hepatoma-derived growth factor-related protein 2 n=1 Tax=Asparagus officinalis TaxID=4686 RepID=UPI00098DF3BA|nr:hepatoma-derived growth factor-related protein 2 [Asparagus officinalis]